MKPYRTAPVFANGIWMMPQQRLLNQVSCSSPGITESQAPVAFRNINPSIRADDNGYVYHSNGDAIAEMAKYGCRFLVHISETMLSCQHFQTIAAWQTLQLGK